MEMKTLGGGIFSASVGEIPARANISEVGPKFFAASLKHCCFGSNIQVVSNNKITLQDGTVAYRTDINWQWQSSFRQRTLLVSAFKDKKWVYLVYTLNASNEASVPEALNEGASIVESLTFR